MRYSNALPTAPFPLLCSVAAGVLAIALTGCGGGGDAASGSAATAAPAPVAPSNSAPTINDAPTSKVGSAQTGKTGDTITLDGSGSSDLNGDSLTYAWTLVSKPAASQASLTGANAVAPSFVADEPGDYVFSLVVNDGRADSEASRVTITISPKTWKDADCTQAGSALPACSRNFSDNQARAEIVTDGSAKVVRLSTDSAAAQGPVSPNNGSTGNKAVFGFDFLHKMKLSEFPSIAFAMKLNPDASGTDTTTLIDAYVTYTISLTCDGAKGSWLNLITKPINMSKVPGADGYVTYSTGRAELSWNRTGSDPFPKTGTALLNGAEGASSAPLNLDALIAAYPNVCVYNWPHPLGGVTPAVVFNLSDSQTVKQKSIALKNIFIGDKRVF